MDLLEIGKNPIPGDAPAGADAKYEPEYEELEAEMAKLTSPSATGGVNWQAIKKLCETILAEKSKDVLCASYMVVALLQTEQLNGLVKGLEFYRVLIEAFWEDMFPPKKRMRGRKNAAEWMFNQGEAFLKDFQAQPMPEETFNKLMENFEAINNFFAEKMEDPPYSRAFMEVLNMIPVQKKEEPKPEGAPAAPGEAPRPAAAGVEAPAEIESDQDAKKVVTAGMKLLRQAATYYLENSPGKATAYSFTRLAAWNQVEAMPPNEDNVTKIPPPPDQVRSVLENLAAEGKWEDLLKAAESKVTQFLFWLDLSRMVYDSLGNMEGDFEAAQKAVAKETGAFVSKFKGIEDFTFADETPFADPDTKRWIAEIALASSEGGGAAAAPVQTAGPADSEQAKVEEEFANAQKMAKKKKLPEAVELLQQGLLTSGSGRSRMMWRMSLARLLLTAKKYQPAQPHLEEILKDIERFGLEEWDPQLALEGFKVVLSAARYLKDEKSVAMAKEVLDHIAKLSPGEALRLEG